MKEKRFLELKKVKCKRHNNKVPDVDDIRVTFVSAPRLEDYHVSLVLRCCIQGGESGNSIIQGQQKEGVSLPMLVDERLTACVREATEGKNLLT